MGPREMNSKMVVVVVGPSLITMHPLKKSPIGLELVDLPVSVHFCRVAAVTHRAACRALRICLCQSQRMSTQERRAEAPRFSSHNA